jgi:hypothetical protein
MDLRHLTDRQKLWIGYGLGAAILVTCIGISLQSASAASLHVLLCLLGGAAGWIAGIVATPLDEDEKTKFSEIMKGFLALGSGYAIAKLEEPVVLAAKEMIKSDSLTLVTRVALFATCFLVGMLFTLVTRLYGETEDKRKQRRVTRLLAQAEEISESSGRPGRPNPSLELTTTFGDK